jgi:hypothetical protein
MQAMQAYLEAILARQVNWSPMLVQWEKLVWAFAADSEGKF